MKHLVITTQIRVHTGPTVVGDVGADGALMARLDARLTQQLGNTFAEYVTELTAREVLDRLTECGYRVLTSCGVGQTCIWTLGKEEEEKDDEKEAASSV